MTKRKHASNRYPHGDERAVSTLVGYALGLAIVTVLISGLLVTTASVVADQRERTVRSELGVIGQQFSADLRAADTLVRADQPGPPAPQVELERDLSETVAGLTYTIAVNQSGCTCLELSTDNPDVSVVVQLATQNPVEATKITGGAVVIEWDTSVSPSKLVVRNA